MTNLPRRRVPGVVGGITAISISGAIVAAQDGGGENGEPEELTGESEYWAVTADSAALTVTSDTDDDVSSDGDIYVTESVSIDGYVGTRGHLVLEDGVEIDGDVTTAGTVVSGASGTIDGDVTAGLDVLVSVDLAQNRSAFKADELAEITDVYLGADGDIDGDILAGGDVNRRHE